MALQSQLFRGDPKLEATAVSDPAHIGPGARGEHVAKIQQALNLLEGAGLTPDGIYGPATAAAVLAYKRKRNIINRSYQALADNIVGKLTIAALDSEMFNKERVPEQRVRLVPVSQTRQLRYGRAISVTPHRSPSLGFAFSPPQLAPNPPQLAPKLEVDNVSIDIPLFGVGKFRVINGIGGTVNCDPNIAVIFDPSKDLSAGSSITVTRSLQEFRVRGLNPGLTIITFQKLFVSLLTMPRPIAVIVRQPPQRVPRDYDAVKGVAHNHAPCEKWPEIQNDPRNAFYGLNESGMLMSMYFTRLCKGCDNPKCVMDGLYAFMRDAVIPGTGKLIVAPDHLDWYLKGGGREYIEDGNISTWIRTDGGLRKRLRSELDKIPDKWGKKSGHFEFEQGHYENQDFRNAWGALDRVNYEFDFVLDECTIWWQDRYEWHPVYEGLYDRRDDDEPRPTNCAHAAAVEMKKQGARDYWMKGEATVPMEVILRE